MKYWFTQTKLYMTNEQIIWGGGGSGFALIKYRTITSNFREAS